MTESIEPITFKNHQGQTIFGMLHTPHESKREYGIIILSPGIKGRVAPHRLYVKMTKLFSQLKFTTLRFDPTGLGDSEGQINEKTAADVYGSIQVGRFIDDTIAAMDWMQAATDIRQFIIAGLCGGAITGLLAGAQDNRVVSLLSLGMPVILDSSKINQGQFITSGQLDDLRDGYFKKIFDLKSLSRFFTLQSDYRLLFKSVFNPFRKRIKHYTSYSDDRQQEPNENDSLPETNFNPHFPKAFIRFVSMKKVLLIFSEADRLYWEFNEKFYSRYKVTLKPHALNFEIYVVPGANHIFSFPEWQNELFHKLHEWLQTNFPESGRA